MNPRRPARFLRVLGILAVCASASIGAQLELEEGPGPGEETPSRTP